MTVPLNILFPNGQVMAVQVYIKDPITGDPIEWDGSISASLGPVTIADGADVAEGLIADAKVVGDVAGSVSAKLRGINTELASIDTKVPALGQALSAGSVPVVLTAAQLAALAPFAAVTVSGSVIANAGTNLNTSLLALEAGHLATIDTSTAALLADALLDNDIQQRIASMNAVQNLLLARQLSFLNVPSHGFTPVEVPLFLAAG